jgi:hypothetical protein
MSQIPHSWAGTLLRSAWHESGLSLRQLARQANTSHATLNAYITGSKSPQHCDARARYRGMRLCPRCVVATQSAISIGVPRGEELADVLALAEQFPVRHSKELDAPIFAERIRSSA